MKRSNKPIPLWDCGADYDDSIPDNDRFGIRDATYARDQFIALGVGVIVGRCGRDVGSPVSALSPSTLALIGQNWVVVRSRLVVIELKRVSCHECHEVSVSPTLGLLTHPVFDEKLSQAAEFHGWVGNPNSGERFALGVHEMLFTEDMCVMDTKGEMEMRLLYEVPPDPLKYRLTMALWNFDEVESCGASEGESDSDIILLPSMINCAAFDGDRSLVVSLQGGHVMAIDLESTWAKKVLVSTPLPFHETLQSQVSIDGIICWKGMIYALLSEEVRPGPRRPNDRGPYFTVRKAGLQCLKTGERIALSDGRAQPIGGPYFAVTRSTTTDGELAEVRSVEEPTKVLCTHKKGTDWESRWCFGNELVVRDITDWPKGIEVADAACGFIIFRMGQGSLNVQRIS
ncbi:hypothetical protein Pelo_15302 [Pelomyxa schiedti]|nr:hypothetical protein Pelo_15302 [Pelomyxa schiedti]